MQWRTSGSDRTAQGSQFTAPRKILAESCIPDVCERERVWDLLSGSKFPGFLILTSYSSIITAGAARQTETNDHTSSSYLIVSHCRGRLDQLGNSLPSLICHNESFGEYPGFRGQMPARAQPFYSRSFSSSRCLLWLRHESYSPTICKRS